MRWLAVLWIITLGAQSQTLGQAPKTGRVTIRPVTTFGVAVRGPVSLDLKEVGSGALFQGRGVSPVLVVPFGIYQLRVQASGFETTTETITVYQAQVEYRIGLTVGLGHAYELTRLDGTLGPTGKAQGDRWVKLSPIYNGGIYQAAINGDGTFTIVGAPRGKYLLSVFLGAEGIHSEPIEIIGAEQTLRVLVAGPGL